MLKLFPNTATGTNVPKCYSRTDSMLHSNSVSFKHSQVAQLLRALSPPAKVAGSIQVKAHKRINQGMHKQVEQQINVSLSLLLPSSFLKINF